MVEIAGMGASALSGGLFGLLGTVAGRVIGVFERREARADRALEMEHDVRRWGHEQDLQALQMEARRQETEDELAITAVAGSYAGLTASLNAEAGIDAPGWVNAVRALVRPVITPLLWVAVFIVFYRTASNEARWIAEAERAALISYLANSVVFAATAATLWWFGDRPPHGFKKE
ncbi:hypothetical protein [Euryhalocaulis caribicus]|uniref:hypothetical protein n=1 Tax=Euryhalocaulis caribicus TaxID=1161401 RepID=UPI00047C490E|nr:hypothetical protein [Euryhalocaulis caribicus]